MKIFSFLSNQPDNVLTRTLSDAKHPFAVAAAFSFFSNLMYLALPLYTYQVYGRVLVSQSIPTLVVLSAITLFCFAVSSAIDDYRARILINYGVLLDQRVSGKVFSALFDASVRGDPSARTQALRDLDQFRQTLTGAAASEISNTYTDIIKAVRQGIQVLIIAIGAYLILKAQIHQGMLFANMILASRALQPIEKIVGAWDPLNNMVRAHGRLMQLLSKAEPSAAATTLPRPKGRLTVEALNFAPPGAAKLLLGNINFAVEAGETLGVIGPSGAGKSTLARLLVGIWRPINGVVRLDGADVFTWDRADFGRHIGYLPQDTELFAGSIRSNIARFRVDVSDEEVVNAAQLAGVHELILRLPKGYETEVGDGGHTLSAGQRQRVGLARAMLGNPAFIVLDEPNASLDAEGEEALLKAIDAMKTNGATVVIISHKPSVFRAADKMLVLREGRIELFGPRDQVMNRLMKPTEVRAVEAGR